MQTKNDYKNIGNIVTQGFVFLCLFACTQAIIKAIENIVTHGFLSSPIGLGLTRVRHFRCSRMCRLHPQMMRNPRLIAHHSIEVIELIGILRVDGNVRGILITICIDAFSPRQGSSFLYHSGDGRLSIATVGEIRQTNFFDKPGNPSYDPRIAALARVPAHHP